MRSFRTTSAIVVVLLLLICVKTAGAGTNKITDNKLFRLEFQIEPAQPVVGNNSAIITLYDASSKAKINDATVEVTPWMTLHGHGSSKKTSVKKQNNGMYLVENLFFTMEGEWDLIVTIEKKGRKDSATLTISNVKKK